LPVGYRWWCQKATPKLAWAVQTAVATREAATDSRNAAAFVLIDNLVTDDEDVHTAAVAWGGYEGDISPAASLAAACAIARFRPRSAGEKPPGKNDKLVGTFLAPVPLADILAAIEGIVDDDAAGMLVIGLRLRPKNGTGRDERDDRADGRRWLADRGFGLGHRPPSTAERQALIAHFFRHDLAGLSDDLRELFSGFPPEDPRRDEVREFFKQLNSDLRRTRKAGHLHADLDAIAGDLGFEQRRRPDDPPEPEPKPRKRSPTNDGRNARRSESGRSTRSGPRGTRPPAKTGVGRRARMSRLVPWRRDRASGGHATARATGAPAAGAPNGGWPHPGVGHPDPPHPDLGAASKPRRGAPRPNRDGSTSAWPFILLGVATLVLLGVALWHSLH